jgi:hypothetical protein
MYADDLLLLSISVQDLQSMVRICETELLAIGLSLNIAKSVCLRIGPRHNFPVSPIKINNLNLIWAAEIRFLGIILLASNSLKCNLQVVRQKFFRALNGIFGKIGIHSSIAVLISLINSFCVPVMLYGIECFNVSLSMYNTLESAFSNAFAKIFKSFDKNVIRQCQYFCNVLPLCDTIDLRRLNFLHGLSKSKNVFIKSLYFLFGKAEFSQIATKHKLSVSSTASWKSNVWCNFSKALNN